MLVKDFEKELKVVAEDYKFNTYTSIDVSIIFFGEASLVIGANKNEVSVIGKFSNVKNNFKILELAKKLANTPVNKRF